MISDIIVTIKKCGRGAGIKSIYADAVRCIRGM
jgi:hypothetical protein